MFLTNPTTEQFSEHVMQIMVKESSKNKQDEALANLVMDGMIEKLIRDRLIFMPSPGYLQRR